MKTESTITAAIIIISVIAIVLVSSMACGTFSFAVRTSSTSSCIDSQSTTSSVPSQISFKERY
ncbi:MAG: hypothetical protein JO297_11340 [Nitrososphaeraceae archaeon]|nr:hypothetical protein [Nitrososphaeraceae archaeon]